MPELRKDPVGGRWVVFSPERQIRPQRYHCVEMPATRPEEDPFLEGHEAYTPPELYAIRQNGVAPNGPGWQVRVVSNRFPALRVEGDLDKEAVGFYDRMNGIGAHEVIVETPHPNLVLEKQSLAGVTRVLEACRARMIDLSKDTRMHYALIFKNHGPRAGATLPHPHTQLIAMPVTPIVVKEKLVAARAYYMGKDRNLFEDILKAERRTGDRVVFENDGFTVFCPFASRFPFETCLMPRRQSADFQNSSDGVLLLLAEAIQRVLGAYASALNQPDYNLILHTAPFRRSRHQDAWTTLDADFRWHIEILPRLTEVAGFEFGTGFYINPTLPEEAANVLREAVTNG
ncbi:MAG: galactose-1-phosphate uridylyltransferase [Verrucomicrobia bacterium]|nr:galactose-1-phosphate uridylyltransferase [Verrucomicrobiota bacterium]